MHAKLGEVDPALQKCGKATALLAEITEDATNRQQRCLRAEGYEYLGYAYNALAAAPDTSAPDTKERIDVARDMFHQALTVLEDLRARGILDASDEQWARSIAGEMAKCDAAVAR